MYLQLSRVVSGCINWSVPNRAFVRTIMVISLGHQKEDQCLVSALELLTARDGQIGLNVLQSSDADLNKINFTLNEGDQSQLSSCI